jgi:chemotaxis regulatin CheY-phosphate phosphatase CheZ
MTNKKLQKLNRKELLELMISQGQEIERLQEQLNAANEELARREICAKEAGSIAEAALRLNRIFEDADQAAQQYLDSIQKMVQQEREALSRIQEQERQLQAQHHKSTVKAAAPTAHHPVHVKGGSKHEP